MLPARAVPAVFGVPPEPVTAAAAAADPGDQAPRTTAPEDPTRVFSVRAATTRGSGRSMAPIARVGTVVVPAGSAQGPARGPSEGATQPEPDPTATGTKPLSPQDPCPRQGRITSTTPTDRGTRGQHAPAADPTSGPAYPCTSTFEI